MKRYYITHPKAPREMAMVEISNGWPVRVDLIGAYMLLFVPPFFAEPVGDMVRPLPWVELALRLEVNGFNTTEV